MLRDPLAHTPHPHVLLAEDDPDQSEMLKDVLESEGYEVDTAFSGDAAWHKLNSRVYNLVLLDVRMPGLNGSEVLRLYRKAEKGTHTPVVIVSAFATEAQAREYSRDGADRIYSKPYEIEELLKGIRELIARSSTAPAKGNGDGNAAPPASNGATPWKQ